MGATLLKDTDVIVVTGKWNVFIFSPEWMQSNIFEEEKIKINYIVPNGPVTFTSDDMSITVSSESLRMRTNRFDGSIFKKMIVSLRTIIRMLAQTPVGAMGVNFRYSVEDENLSVFFQEVFKTTNGILKEERKWTLEGDANNEKLNLSLTKNGELYIVDFNYHYQISDITAIASLIEDDTLIFSKYEEAISKMADFFNITAELS